MHHPDAFSREALRIDGRILGNHDYVEPALVLIHATDRCNHHCPWCWFSRTSDKIDMDRALITLDYLLSGGVKEITVSGGGEPLLHPEIGKLLKRLSRVPEVQRRLFTHGGLLDRHRESVAAAFDYVRISIDAGKASTYAALHGVKHSEFDKLFENARALAEGGTHMGASVVVTPDNQDEIAPLLERCVESGIRSVVLKPVLDGDSLRPMPSLPGLDGYSSVVNIMIRDPNEQPRKHDIPELPVTVATLGVALIADNSVVPCCHLTSAEWVIAKVGHVKKEAFRDRHAQVARKYAVSVHPCEYHEAWRVAAEGVLRWST